jgi:hypothetical protein
MVMLDYVVEILDLADDDRRAVRFVVSPDSGRIGLTAIDSDRFRDAMATNRLGQKPPGRSLVALLGQ